MSESPVVLGYLCSQAGTMRSGATQPGEVQESQTGQMAHKTSSFTRKVGTWLFVKDER